VASCLVESLLLACTTCFPGSRHDQARSENLVVTGKRDGRSGGAPETEVSG